MRTMSDRTRKMSSKLGQRVNFIKKEKDMEMLALLNNFN